MRNILLIIGFAVCFCYVSGKNVCQPGPYNLILDKVPSNCTLMMKNQIKEEIKASFAYLAMGTHFAQDYVNRPGFADFFFKSASEERQHAIKLMEYLLMRGGQMNDFKSETEVSSDLVPKSTSWDSALSALNEALALEKSVTKSIDNVAKQGCEPDLHLVDYLTTEYLDEQFKGMRDLAGKISTLTQMKSAPLGEFLYDKKLLKGEII